MKDSVRLLAGSEFECVKPWKPFDKRAVSFLSDLSAEIFRNPMCRSYESIVAFAFWCRAARLKSMEERFSRSGYRLGVGLAFHIAPSNVPLMFAYSWVMGLLSGNGNIVRVSTKATDMDMALLSVISDMLNKPENSEIKERSSFISYEHSSEINAYYSQICDARIVWGGDETVNALKAIPVQPHAREIFFPDRWSLAVMDAEKVKALDADGLKTLAHSFFNDTYLMDQNACSSPQLIVWVNGTAQEAFWEALAAEAEEKYPMDGFRSARKYEAICTQIMAMNSPEVVSLKKYAGNALYAASLNGLPKAEQLPRGNFGLFFQCETVSPSDILPICTPKLQTVSYFGIDPEQLAEALVCGGAKGADQIVPIGQAMDMNVIWDGKSFIDYLSRIIRVGE